MTVLTESLAALALLLLLWSYGVYPLLITRLSAGRAALPSVPDAPAPVSIEVILAAADEEAVIGPRVANLLSQEGVGRVSIGCDGCRDATAARAREAGGGGTVRVVEFPTSRGKAAVLNDLVSESTADLLVFTDANTRFEPGAVVALARAFQDATVGAACGRLVFERGEHARETPESDFWDRETRLKAAEGRLGICLGANGAIYAVRRELVTKLPEDTTSMDDFLIPVRVARAGKAIVFASEAVAREDAARDVAAEISRRFRIGVGAGQVLLRETWLLNVGAHPMLTLAYLSRKAARWLAPLLALAAAVAALAVPGWRLAGACVLALALLLLLAARLRPRLAGWPGRIYYFGVLNLALALGVVSGLFGYSRPVWTRTARS